MTRKHILFGVLVIIISSLYFIYGANGNQTLLDQTISHNNKVYDGCFVNGGLIQDSSDSTGSANEGSGNVSGGVASGSVSMTDVERYKKATQCWKSQRRMVPNDLFLTVPKHLVDEGKCAISQSEDEHVRPERGGMYATDIACKFANQGVYAPDYLDDMKEYTIEEVGTDRLMGNFVILSFNDKGETRGVNDIRWYFGHTVLDKGWKVGDTVTTGVRFAHADLSGATTGWHTHIELRRMYDGVWHDQRYMTLPVNYRKNSAIKKIDTLDDLHQAVCEHQPSSPLCKDKDLFNRLHDITEERLPGKNFYPILLGITNAESSLGLNFAKDNIGGTCAGRNNWGGVKWQITDTGERIKDQKIPDQYGCWLYKFDSIEHYWISKVNTVRFGYKGCVDHKTPIRCMSYAYVGNRYVAEESWIKNVSIFLD